MFLDYESYEYWLRAGPTDMRFGALRLARLVITEMGHQPMDRSMFIFCGSSNKMVKILVWDHNGFWLASKRIMGRGGFAWPTDGQAAKNISFDEVLRFLSGQDCFRRLPAASGQYSV
ncbi:MAG: IS66 family insertion sequence element accessory protein TnpB [Sphaerochaeta sp.]|jgi:transposase|nr:IS66 family insertion sequence element accessory protein TnpB [Spirochaetales bacterium]